MGDGNWNDVVKGDIIKKDLEEKDGAFYSCICSLLNSFSGRSVLTDHDASRSVAVLWGKTRPERGNVRRDVKAKLARERAEREWRRRRPQDSSG